MNWLEHFIYWAFPDPGVCDDTPDAHAPKPHQKTGMEFDSGEDLLRKG